MRIFTTIFLTITIFIQTFSSYIIEADFFINRAYIAKNLCVNREKPVMKCEGKCYLSKKLKEQEKQDQQAPVSKSETFNIVPFFVPEVFSFQAIASVSKTEFIIKNEGLLASLPHNIFHPPTAL